MVYWKLSWPRTIPVLSPSTKHVLHCCLLCAIIIVFIGQLSWSSSDTVQVDPYQKYGTLVTSLLYLFRFLALLAFPQCLCNFLGLTVYNAFPEKVQLKGSTLQAPFISIRTVTRGDFAELVKSNVNRNLNTCLAVGLENFIIEVVSDKPLNLPTHPRIRELVVPSTYSSKTGTLYKARALQYCLEDENNILGDNDWIVHLDEETILTENVVRGILNFVQSGKHEFGQGLITYANEEIINWATTLADSFRVAEDMGKLRFQFYMFHRPLFSWKGSYVVSRFRAERDVSYDHGLDGSVAEDCYFSMIAYKKGYTFDFIEGEMWEKSPFTIKDFIQQRKRWMQGIFLVVHSPLIPFQNKLFLTMSLYAWMTIPLSTSNILWAYLFPLPTNEYALFNTLVAFVGAVNIYLYIFGVFKSFSLIRLGYRKFALCVIGAILCIPFNIVIENVAVIWGLFGKKHKFYIVQKQIEPAQIV
ncbi:Beta-1,4-mannosyltransferase egh [Halotydeus destructor]|nr:Beta-1,4-mannosyltransferase egh [Halotydeus destructor]